MLSLPKYFLLLFCIQISFVATAQLNYRVSICDSLTGLTIAPDKINLFVFKENTNENATLSRGRMYTHDGYNEIIYRTFTLPHCDGVYDMTIDAEGYISRSMKLSASIHETDIDLGKIMLERIPKQLNEVSVVATKIKVFFDGDTMIYNADAFILPEGSMLDALVKQLPGVECKSDGQIFHNGKKVESMLLNGQKLFDNDPTIMLNNLAAYTVKNIKVYEKDSESASLLGYSDDKEYVMDVNLKKQYMGTTSVLAEGGYGTENRYLGRLFATTFTSTSAVAAYLNANNLSTRQLPWSNTDIWDTRQISRTGVTSYIGGGMNYSLNSSKRKESLRGNIEATHTTTDALTGSQGILFLPDGNNVSASSSRNWDRSLKLTTSHRYMRQFNNWQLNVSAKFDYGKSHTESNSDSEVSWETDHSLINHSLHTESSLSHNLKGNLKLDALIRLPDIGETKQNLSVWANGDYTRSHGRLDTYSLIDYGYKPDKTQSEQACRQAYPAYILNSAGDLRYNLRFPHNYSLSLGVSHDQVLDRNTDFRFILPEYTLDPTNSARTMTNDGTSAIYLISGARWGYLSMANGGKGQLEINIAPSISFLDRSYTFIRPDADAMNPTRHETIWSLKNLSLDYKLTPSGRNKLEISLKASSIVHPLNMAYLIDVLTDADPLNIHRGNPNLRNSRTNTLELKPSFELITQAYNVMNYFTIKYTTIDNDIVNGWKYNPETGVRCHSQYNVDGTRHFNVGLFSWLYGNTWSIRWKNEYTNKRNADMVGISTAEYSTYQPTQEFVYNNSYDGSLKGSFNPWKWFEFSPEVNSRVSHFKSSAKDFIAFTAIDMTYKINLHFKLPHNLFLTTDLALNTRRGYTDSRINTNEWILNAGAQWHWARPGLRFILDGYDLLQQISRISYVINAQGRTESWDNTIPRYVMLRIIYQFNASK